MLQFSQLSSRSKKSMKSNIVLAGPGAQTISGPCVGSFGHGKERRERGRKPATRGGGLSSQDHHSMYQPKKWEAVATLSFCPVSCPPICSVGPES